MKKMKSVKLGLALFVAISCTIGVQQSKAQTSEVDTENDQFQDIPVHKKNTGNPDYDEIVYRRNLIEYFRGVYDLPEFVSTGDREADIEAFNKSLKVWYQSHPDFISVLGMKSYKDFVKYDITCYPPPPDFQKSDSDEAYRKAFQTWMAHHPEAPKLQGDDMASKEKFEREKAMFYELYYKK